jgi:glutamine cyclotransferase
LRKVDLETGRVIEMKMVPPQYFAEGLTVIGEKIIQLTWQARLGFVYDKQTLDKTNQFNTTSEGWGLTHDEKRLIMSDGTSVLRFLEPETYTEVGRLEVKENGNPVTWVNELEIVNGEIFANIWQSERIARIDPETGAVTGWVDLTGLLSVVERGPTVDVLNGIAYDPVGDRLFVTGKGWPKLFEIELVPLN